MGEARTPGHARTVRTAYRATPAMAHAPSVRSTDQPRPKMSTQPSTMIATASHWMLARTGAWKLNGPATTWCVWSNRVCTREERREAGDDADDGGGDAGERGGQRVVVPQPLDVRRAEQDEQEARHERHPGRQAATAMHRGNPRVQRPGIAIGADERDELHDHDQRPRGGLGQRKPAHHLPRRQPAVDVDGLLGDVGQHGVGAAEGDHRGAGEEQALVDEDAVAAEEQRGHGDRREPQHQPDAQDRRPQRRRTGGS